jgi:hypothetical protein
MGQIRRIIAKDSEAARKDLLKIFQLKFGSSFETGTLSGLKAVFGNLFEQSFARVGDAMLPAAKSFVGAINAELKHFIEGGPAEEWGKRAGKWLTESVDKIIAAWQTMKTIAGQMEDNWDKGGAGIGGIVSAAITGGISFLLTTMFRVLGASVDVWAGIGKVLGAALIETILQIPGLGPMRDSMAIANINSMSQAEREQTAKKYGTYDSSAKSIEVYAMSHPKVAREIAVGDQNANLLKAIKGMMTIGPDLLTGIQADMAAYRATVDAALAGAGMSGITSTYEANLARRKSARYAQENPGVAKDYAQMIKLRSGALPGRQSWNLVRQAQKFSWLGVTDAPTSGPRAASGKLPTTINIGTVQVQANDAWTFVQSLGYNARSPILAAASL